MHSLYILNLLAKENRLIMLKFSVSTNGFIVLHSVDSVYLKRKVGFMRIRLNLSNCNNKDFASYGKWFTAIVASADVLDACFSLVVTRVSFPGCGW